VTARLGIPYVLAEASYAPKQAGGAWDLGHRAAAEAIGRADIVFQPNPGDSECLLPLVRSPDAIVALPPFVETARLRAPDRQASRVSIAAAFGLPEDEPWLIAVAMMREDQKLASYRLLAEAMRLVADVPWRLVLAGAGPAEARVRAMFAAFGQRVRFPGLLDEATLGRLYRAADLYVWPAVKEAWGMALIEAQASGLPAVAGYGEGVAGVVADGESGLLAPQGDAAAFSALVRSLLADPARRHVMSIAARERARARHDIAVAAALLDRRIRAIVQR
jgi:glycosyltransferase involved in cell wall biosynthesis